MTQFIDTKLLARINEVGADNLNRIGIEFLTIRIDLNIMSVENLRSIQTQIESKDNKFITEIETIINIKEKALS